MDNDRTDILLGYADKVYGLSSGHQSETAQLLDLVKELRDALYDKSEYIERLLGENEQLKQEIENCKRVIAAHQKPTLITTVNGPYIENQTNILPNTGSRQMQQQPKIGRRHKRDSFNSLSQLSLW